MQRFKSSSLTILITRCAELYRRSHVLRQLFPFKRQGLSQVALVAGGFSPAHIQGHPQSRTPRLGIERRPSASTFMLGFEPQLTPAPSANALQRTTDSASVDPRLVPGQVHTSRLMSPN